MAESSHSGASVWTLHRLFLAALLPSPCNPCPLLAFHDLKEHDLSSVYVAYTL